MAKLITHSHIVSLTEWFASIHERQKAAALRKEDNERVERLELLRQMIGLQYERPTSFPATELTTPSPRFQKVLRERGHEHCAIRLVPKNPSLPKLRQRGWTIKKCYHEWFLKQTIDPEQYTAYILPHTPRMKWSSIFVVNDQAVFGEIIQGLPIQLTHGETIHRAYYFTYDFKSWHWSKRNTEAQRQIQRHLNYVRVINKQKQALLRKKLGATFSHNYLSGYFEGTVWPNNKSFIIDYNRLLANAITLPRWRHNAEREKNVLLTGLAVSPGIVTGKAVIIAPERIARTKLKLGSILVCDNTDVRYLPLMKQAAAIVTNRGGMLSHPAIVSRELGIPCVVNTKRATTILTNGLRITVDADHGIIRTP